MKIKPLLVALLAALIAVPAFFPAMAHAVGITMSAAGPDGTVADLLAPGDSFTLTVGVDDATGVTSAALCVEYDPSAFTLVEVNDPGQEYFTTGDPSTPFQDGMFVDEVSDPVATLVPSIGNAYTPGKVMVSGGYVDSGTGGGLFTGPMPLFVLSMQVNSSGVAEGDHVIRAVQTRLLNPAAGWGAASVAGGPVDTAEPVPVLTGALDNSDPDFGKLDQAYYTILGDSANPYTGTDLTITVSTQALGPPPPAIDPPHDSVVTSPVTVTLAPDDGAEATYYSMDGSDPDDTYTPYTAPFDVSGAHGQQITIKGVSYSGGNPGQMSFATYTFDLVGPDMPGMAPASGVYTASPVSVTITPAAGAQSTWYTTDGAVPDNTRTAYTGPFDIAGADGDAVTVSAASYDAAGNLGATATRTYTFDLAGPAGPSGFSPASGTYNTGLSVSFNVAPDATDTYYVLAPAPAPNPTYQTGTWWDGSPVSVDGTHGTTLELKVISYDAVGNPSGVSTASYTFDRFGPMAPGVEPATGIFSASPVAVSITPAGDATRTYYTTDGTSPDATDTLYSGTFDVAGSDGQTVTVVAASYDAAGNRGAETTRGYTFDLLGPIGPFNFQPAPGAYNTPVAVVFDTANDAAETYYTLALNDAPDPTDRNGTLWQGIPIQINGVHGQTWQIKARSYDAHGNPSGVPTVEYMFDMQGPAAPTFTPAGGWVTASPVQVTINAAPDALSVYYTTDGSSPDNTKTPYTGPFSLAGADGQSITVNAAAYDAAGNLGATGTAGYVFDLVGPDPPTGHTPAPGAYATDVSVSVTPAADAVETRYTLDGAVPTTSDELLAPAGSVSITGTAGATTVANLAMRSWDAAGNAGPAGTVTYTIDKQAPGAPLLSPAGGTYTRTVMVTAQLHPEAYTTTYTLDGTAPSPGSGTLYQSGDQIPISGNAGQAVTLRMASTDRVGNTGPSATGTYTFTTGFGIDGPAGILSGSPARFTAVNNPGTVSWSILSGQNVAGDVTVTGTDGTIATITPSRTGAFVLAAMSASVQVTTTVEVVAATSIVDPPAAPLTLRAMAVSRPFTAAGGNGVYTWRVEHPDGASSFSSGPVFRFRAVPEGAFAGPYTVTVADGYGFASDPVTIHVPIMLSVEDTNGDMVTMCRAGNSYNVNIHGASGLFDIAYEQVPDPVATDVLNGPDTANGDFFAVNAVGPGLARIRVVSGDDPAGDRAGVLRLRVLGLSTVTGSLNGHTNWIPDATTDVDVDLLHPTARTPYTPPLAATVSADGSFAFPSDSVPWGAHHLRVRAADADVPAAYRPFETGRVIRVVGESTTETFDLSGITARSETRAVTVTLAGAYTVQHPAVEYLFVRQSDREEVRGRAATQSFGVELPPGTYTMALVGEGYEPCLWTDPNDPDTEVFDPQVTDQLTAVLVAGDGYNPDSPTIEASHIPDANGFVLNVCATGFANFGVTEQNGGAVTPLDTRGSGQNRDGDQYTRYRYTWRADSGPWTSRTTSGGATTYTTVFVFTEGMDEIATYPAVYTEYANPGDANDDKGGNQRDIEDQTGGDAAYQTLGSREFLPMVGTTFTIPIKDSTGAEVPVEITIPPLPLQLLYIDDFGMVRPGTDNMRYTPPRRRGGDEYDTSGNPNLRRISPQQVLRVEVEYYTFINEATGAGAFLEFYAVGGPDDGARVRYNPFTGPRMRGRVRNAPPITLPLLLNVQSPFFDKFKRLSEAGRSLNVVVTERGDSHPSFRNESVDFDVFDDGLVLLYSPHLSGWTLSRGGGAQAPPTSVSGGDAWWSCFIGSVAKHDGNGAEALVLVVLLLLAAIPAVRPVMRKLGTGR
ncbi:MAG: chitobiase/beta-hexosaminidase C-terminal domain-containing protein [Desulfatibacillaceae bacterium]